MLKFCLLLGVPLKKACRRAHRPGHAAGRGSRPSPLSANAAGVWPRPFAPLAPLDPQRGPNAGAVPAGTADAGRGGFRRPEISLGRAAAVPSPKAADRGQIPQGFAKRGGGPPLLAARPRITALHRALLERRAAFAPGFSLTGEGFQTASNLPATDGKPCQSM